MADDASGRRLTVGFRRRVFPTYGPLAGALRRRALVPLALALAAVATPIVWRSIQLAGLPDVGEPFDVKAFRAETVPDRRNAFVAYREAIARYKPLVGREAEFLRHNSPVRWESATPEVRAWLEENRGALAVFREGAERPDALDWTRFEPRGGRAECAALRRFFHLTFLEASRLESLGDMDGTRECYRAIFRAIHHFAWCTGTYWDFEGSEWGLPIQRNLISWAAHPRTTPAHLRRAIDDLNACAALDPPEAYLLKREYLARRPVFYGENAPPPGWLVTLQSLSTFGTGTPLLTTDHLRSFANALSAEPERGRRVARLVAANRLALYALPPDRRPKPDTSIPLCDLYPVGPDAPAAARALPIKALGRRLDVEKDLPLLRLMWSGCRSGLPKYRRFFLAILTSELARLEPPTSPVPPPAPNPVP